MKKLLLLSCILFIVQNGFSQTNGFIVKSDKYAVLDVTGKQLFDCDCDTLISFYPNFIFVKNKLKGVISKTGNIILSPNYQEILLGNQNQYLLKKENKWAISNAAGQLISGYKYTDETIKDKIYIEDNIGGSSDFEVFEENNLYGLKENDKITIPPTYEFLSFDYCYVKVKTNNKWGIVTVENKWIVEPEFDAIGNLDCLYAVLGLNGKQGVLDIKNRKLVIDYKYQYIILTSYY